MRLITFAALIILLANTALAESRLTYKKCSDEQKGLISNIIKPDSIPRINQLEGEIIFYLRKQEIRSSRVLFENLSKIQATVQCIKEKLRKKLDIVCIGSEDESCDGTYALVHPRKLFKKNNVNLCSIYWDRNADFQTAVFIHELSHFCGAVDWEYFDEPFGPTSKPPQFKTITFEGRNIQMDISHDNADSYEYWVRYGFCLPGYDC